MVDDDYEDDLQQTPQVWQLNNFIFINSINELTVENTY